MNNVEKQTNIVYISQHNYWTLFKWSSNANCGRDSN